MITIATTPNALEDLPDGTIIRGPSFVAEATTTSDGRQWATTTGQKLDSAAVLANGPAVVIDVPHFGNASIDGRRELAEVIAASAELSARQAQRRRASQRLATKITQAHNAGVSYQDIADALGISRQRVAAIATDYRAAPAAPAADLAPLKAG